MNIDKLKAMLELNAVQNFGSTSTENSSVFQDLLNELLENNDIPQTLTNNFSNPVTSVAKTSLPPMSLLKTGSDPESEPYQMHRLQ
jgi:hypothetical protein